MLVNTRRVSILLGPTVFCNSRSETKALASLLSKQSCDAHGRSLFVYNELHKSQLNDASREIEGTLAWSQLFKLREPAGC